MLASAPAPKILSPGGRWGIQVPEQTVATIMRLLGCLDDVEDDATVPIKRKPLADVENSRSFDIADHSKPADDRHPTTKPADQPYGYQLRLWRS